MIVVSSVLSSIVHIIWFYILFFSVSKAKSSGVRGKIRCFLSIQHGRFVNNVYRTQSSVERSENPSEKIAERMAHLTRMFLFIMYKRKNKKKSLKNVSQFDDERACSIFYLRLVVFLFFFLVVRLSSISFPLYLFRFVSLFSSLSFFLIYFSLVFLRNEE